MGKHPMRREIRTIVLTNRAASERGARVPRWGRRVALGVGLAAATTLLLRGIRGALGEGEAQGEAEPHFDDVFFRGLDASRALVDGRLSQTAWQDVVEAGFRAAQPEEVGRAIALDSLLSRGQEAVPIRGAALVPVSLPFSGEAPSGFGARLLVLRAGRANPPHGHDNVAAIHYVLRGRFRVRHYDRVREEPEGVVLKPTIDRVLRPGDATSVSDKRDNVHWHLAETDGVLLVVYCKDLGGLATAAMHLDPVNAHDLGGSMLRAPRLPSLGEALERFG